MDRLMVRLVQRGRGRWQPLVRARQIRRELDDTLCELHRLADAPGKYHRTPEAAP